MIFLVTNAGVCLAFSLFAFPSFFADDSPASRGHASWAGLLLAYLVAQILVRLIVIIAFAVVHWRAADEKTVYVEDEMDVLIDLKSTSAFFAVFMAGFALSLLAQTLGAPIAAFFAALGLSLMISGLVADLRKILHYRRGV